MLESGSCPAEGQKPRAGTSAWPWGSSAHSAHGTCTGWQRESHPPAAPQGNTAHALVALPPEAWERELRSGQLESFVISDNVMCRCASPQTAGYHRGRENKLPVVPTATHRLNHNTCSRYFLLKEERGKKEQNPPFHQNPNTALILPSFVT